MKMGCCGSRKHNWKAALVRTENSDQDSDPNDETAPVTETGTRLWDPMGREAPAEQARSRSLEFRSQTRLWPLCSAFPERKVRQSG